MKSIRLESFDLNLMKLFVAIADTGSVTRAAEQVGLTQPSASNALGRMRLTLGDALFIRTRHEMVPTRYATEVLPAVRVALAGLVDALNRAAAFDPQDSRRRFRLSLSGLGEAVFLPALTKAILSEAPHVILQNDPIPLSELGESLLSGRADLAVGLISIATRGVQTLTLFNDNYVAICAPGRDHMPKSIDELKSERLLLAAPAATYGREMQAILTRLGLEGNVSLIIQEFGALPELLQEGKYTAIVPGRYGRTLARAGRVTILPVMLGDIESPVNMVWSAQANADPGLRWFLGIVKRCLSVPAEGNVHVTNIPK